MPTATVTGLFELRVHNRNQGVGRRSLAMLLAVATLLLLAPLAQAQPLAQELQRLMNSARLGDTRLGIIIIDADTSEVLASHNEGDAFIPASNMKLLTSGAALAILGPDFTFRTELLHAGDALIVRGSGDPAFADPRLLRDMQLGVEEIIQTWTRAAADAGVTGITELILDDRIFDDDWVHPSWPVEQLNRWYCAEVYGLNFHANVLSVYVSPTRPGMSPTVRTQPEAPWLNIGNIARTVTDGQNTIWVSRAAGTNSMRLHGNVRQTAERPIEVAVHDMPGIFGRLLAEELERAGVGRPSVRRAAPDEMLPQGKPIALVQTPMRVVMERCNTDSHNLYAEALIKRMGHELTGRPGSWSTGAAAIRMVMQEKLNPRHAADVVIADGSGMSRQNRVTPQMIAQWLLALARDEEIRTALEESLPIPAESGTLRRRFGDTELRHTLRAKTGYLSGVTSLSGYLWDENSGRRIVFSILVNEVPSTMPMRRVRDFQEQVVSIADQWLARATLAEVVNGE
ncbi:MAG: D-alanyl-D-alanine carboxypeptidase/D-alanyl-D-alanine-endopeptidase [Phycisphaeraceae bacterium]|nr:MAG: D-alanyl-D-alanine carboxypeptidase/D-alanyl-D-alanine-endopeptidase [Phycisphaeraceae bacterium]